MASMKAMGCMVLHSLSAALVALAVPAAAFADPPLRAARVSFVSRSVSLRPAQGDE